MSRWRLAAAALILAGLVAVGALTAPAYLRNWRLQTYLDQLVRRPETHTRPPEQLRSEIVGQTAKMGVKLYSSAVQIERLPGGTAIEVSYSVPVDLALYTVNLHMRSAAGH